MGRVWLWNIKTRHLLLISECCSTEDHWSTRDYLCMPWIIGKWIKVPSTGDVIFKAWLVRKHDGLKWLDHNEGMNMLNAHKKCISKSREVTVWWLITFLCNDPFARLQKIYYHCFNILQVVLKWVSCENS